MSQKLSRRSFLKTAGAVAVAAAAMSTLTACGGGGSSTPDSKPTPSTPTTPTTLGGIEIQKITNRTTCWSSKDGIPVKWGLYLNATIKNTSNKDIPIGDFEVEAKIDSTNRTPYFVGRLEGENHWYSIDPTTPLKAGESMTIEVAYETTKAFYDEWKAGKGDHSFEATLIYDGKKVTYSSKTGKLGNVENA